MKIVHLRISLLILLLMTGSIIASQSNSGDNDIIFDHRLHVDLECTDCHESAISGSKSDDKLFPDMESCGNCHDIEDDDNCGTCHRDIDEPQSLPNPARSIYFSHKKHYELEIACLNCHGSSATIVIPGKPQCMECHDGQSAKNECRVCHGDSYSLSGIHPLNWRDQHGSQAVVDEQFCSSCHRNESFCIDCHQGDNTDGTTHELNYRYTHGLDAGGKETNCYNCHDNRTFCNDCHLGENRMPLEHSTLNWISEHGEAARNNIENCAACHDSADPSCARAGCHADNDGLRGTDPRIHSDVNGGEHSSWHNDDGSLCYQCHTNTRTAGIGFCGYCHGFED